MAVRVETVGLEHEIAHRLTWLDAVAARMEQAFAPFLGQEAPRGPRDLLYGTWLGHPLHAAVITVPVGSWSATMIFDLMGEERAADLSLGLGLVVRCRPRALASISPRPGSGASSPTTSGSASTMLPSKSRPPSGLPSPYWTISRMASRTGWTRMAHRSCCCEKVIRSGRLARRVPIWAVPSMKERSTVAPSPALGTARYSAWLTAR
jgi:hypothetical protein